MYAAPKTDLDKLQPLSSARPTDTASLAVKLEEYEVFWDRTGKQWASGGFHSKFAGVFVSTSGQGGGQESTAVAAMSTLAHHGIIFVPLGYGKAFPLLADLTEVRGGSPWGAGTFSSVWSDRIPMSASADAPIV